MLLTNAYDPDPRVRQEALALVGMGCRVRLLVWDRDGKSPASEYIEGVEVERIHLKSTHGRGNTQILFYALLYLRLIWRALKTSFDTLHCHDLDTLPAGYVIGKLKRKAVVYDAHESFPDMLVNSVHPAVCKALTWLETMLVRRTDLLITVGEKLRAYFESRGARRSVVVGNWKRPEEFHRTPEQRQAVRHRLGIPDGALTVVCITNLLPDRKLEELLDAVDRSPGVYAIVGGSGTLRPLIEQRASANPRIVYVGFVRGSEIPDYTCAADVVYYGFDEQNPNAKYSAPNKLFEALAAGRPLITGDFGEIADVVRATGCGVVLGSYTPEFVAAALARMRDSASWNDMADRARQAGRTGMNWATAERILYSEYSRLLGPGLELPASTAPAAAVPSGS
jgi:glycosyltransferase involved in cell wall biosynthesis